MFSLPMEEYRSAIYDVTIKRIPFLCTKIESADELL